MNTTAFFFQGDFLVLPADIPDSQMDKEISLDYLKDYDSANLKTGLDAKGSPFGIFEIPAIDSSIITNSLADGVKTICCVSVPTEYKLPAGWRAVQIRQSLSQIIGGVEKDSASESAFDLKSSVCRLFRAYHIVQWKRDYQFCASCGIRNIDSPIELARLCPGCGRLEFPRISPAVITIIINDEDKALLAHNKIYAPGVYSIIAGFNEAGESIENTVVREIREEVGLEVRDVRYIASQPWPFRNSLMLGFCARHASGAIRVDGVEIEDAQWFSRDNLPKFPGSGSISRYLISRWVAGTL